MTLLMLSFARGVELSRSASKAGRSMIENDLKIDLLRIDKLSVIGRSAARFALIWFTVSAIMFLFFIGGGLTDATIGLLAGSIAMGIWVFVAMMERVHHKIRAAKAAELERLRTQIDAVRQQTPMNADSAQTLQALLAYETRITAAPEWPFDQTTLVRVAASALILAVPWFGQAIAGYVVEQLDMSPIRIELVHERSSNRRRRSFGPHGAHADPRHRRDQRLRACRCA